MTTNTNRNAEHKRIFEDKLAASLANKATNTTFLSESEYQSIRGVVQDWSSLPKEEKKQLGSKAYQWVKKYAVVGNGDAAVLIFNEVDEQTVPAGEDEQAETAGTEVGPLPALDKAKVVSHGGRIFEDLYDVHVAGGHCKAKTFEARLKEKFGKSIPRFAVRDATRCHTAHSFTTLVSVDALILQNGAHSAEWTTQSAELALVGPLTDAPRSHRSLSAGRDLPGELPSLHYQVMPQASLCGPQAHHHPRLWLVWAGRSHRHAGQ